MALSATVLGCAGPTLPAAEAAFFRDADPWGFILFARNVESPDQLRRLTGDLRAAVGRDALIFVDQEGGRVQRLRAPHWREYLPPFDQVAATAGPGMERGIFLRYQLIALELRATGIDANCAPSADLATPQTHAFLRNRCFFDEAETVIRAARAAADGLFAGGVLPVVKHMPGHGRATLDSHHDLPRVTAPLDVLEESDFKCFRALVDLPMAMTAHLVFTALDPERPATVSPEVIGYIRHRIGFGGLLISDDLSMQALAGTLDDRAARAVAAGCDIALHCNGQRAEMAAVVAGAGALCGAALRRADAAFARRPAATAGDTEALAAELAALLGTGAHV